MKKSIVIVVVVAVIILGLFVWVGQSKHLEGTLNNLKAEKSATLEKLKDSVLNSATLSIASAVDNYYYQKNPTISFEKDVNSINTINAYIAGIKSQFNLDVEYFVYSTKTNFVVKTMAKGASNFYCLDITTESVKPIIIESTTDFTVAAGCKDEELR